MIGLVNGMLRDFGLYPDRYGKPVFFAVIALAMLTMGSAFLFPTKVYKKRKGPAPDTRDKFDTADLPGELPAADTSDLADINFPAAARERVMAEVPSVTEHTTRHLK